MNAIYLSPRKTLWRRMKAWLIGFVLYVKYRQWLQRPALERLGREAARIVKEAWLVLVEASNKIKTAESYKAVGTWEEYCKLTWGISSSHLSHFRSAAPYAKALIESGVGGAPMLEAHLRRLKKHVPLENPLMSAAYVLGNRVAGKNAPTEAIYRRSLEVLEQAQQTGGYVQVGEKTYILDNEDSAVAAVKETLAEVKRVILQNNVPIEVTAKRREDGTWDIEAESELPRIIKFKVYL